MPENTVKEIEFTPSQETAMTFRGKDLLVSAAAGSGKTRVLIERIIKRLTDETDPVSLSELLVVTFTRNATAELKRRISKALHEALAKNPGDERLSRELLALGSAQISTIDAFFQKLAREHFDLLDIPRMFRMVKNEELAPISERLMKETLEDLYSASRQEKKEFFQSISKNEFASAMDHLLNVKQEAELRKKLLELEEKFHKLPGRLSLLQESAKRLEEEKNLPYFSTLCGQKLHAYTKERFENFARDLQEFTALPTQSFEQSVKDLANSDLAFCRRVLDALNQSYDQAKAALLTFEAKSFPRKCEKTVDVLAYQEFRNSFKSTLNKKILRLYSSNQVDIQQEMDESAKFALALYTCLSEFNRRLMEEKKARGIFTFDDIACFAHKLLQDGNGEPTAIAKELAKRYREVYVDEYQDVNRLQDDVFRLLGNGRRFLVGDIKQSIYRFRGGDPEVFSGYRKVMPLYSDPAAKDASGVCVFMSDNFRCDEPIINAANRVCSFLFSKASREMDYREEDNLVFHKYKNTDGMSFPPVKVRLFGPEPGAEIKQEHRYVADQICALLKSGYKASGEKIEPKDIAILVRNNDQAQPFETLLRERGISVNVQGDDDSQIPTELIDLMNLLAVIDNPHRDLPLLEFLQSPMGGFRLEELVLVQSKVERGTCSLFDALEQYQEQDELAERIAKMLAFFEDARRLAQSLPVDKFLQKLYETEPLQALADSDIPVYLYDQARSYSASAYTGLYEFLIYFEKRCNDRKLPKNIFLSEENAVQILTIHKSKGEEYPAVFVTSLAASFPEKELRSSVFISRETGFSAKLFDRRTLLMRSSTDYEVSKFLLMEKLREEQIRLLYVAMTRPRERLYLTGSISGKKGIETFLKESEAIRTAGRHEILDASSPMNWVFAMLDREKGPYWERDILEAGTYAPGEEDVAELPDSTPKPIESKSNLSYNRYAKILEDEKSFVNGRAVFQKLPSKVAASKITPDLLDRFMADDEEVSIATRLELLHSATTFSGFLSELKKPGATDYGSAAHAFLQFCNFEALAKSGPKEEADRLVKEGYLRPESLALLRFDLLQKFINSSLFAKILSAKGLRREQQFARLIPMCKLTQNQALKEVLGEETVFVQGAIDLILETNEGFVLVDYKTDRLQEGESAKDFRARMLMLHGSQLKTYADAMEQIFSEKPVSICLYSLPLGETIEFSMSELPE